MILTGCQTVAPIASTPSGKPEAIFTSTSAEDISGRIASACMSQGLMVFDQSNYQVLCGKTMTGGDSVMAQLLIGNSYSTTPEQKIRFAIANTGSGIRVQASQWIETQMAFGQMRRQELNGGKHFNDVQNFLYSIGGTGFRAYSAQPVHHTPAPKPNAHPQPEDDMDNVECRNEKKIPGSTYVTARKFCLPDGSIVRVIR